MKCIKAIRASKDVELGEIRRVDDKTAAKMVGSSWQYVPKAEWKAVGKTALVQEVDSQSDEVKPKKRENKKKKS